MDRNSLIGIFLIGLILVVFSIMNQPSAEELARQKQVRDSIAEVERIEEINAQTVQNVESKTQPLANDSLIVNDSISNDSLLMANRIAKFGLFSNASEGNEKQLWLENDRLKVTFSTKGGKPIQALLKSYKTYQQNPLQLFDEDSTRFGLTFFAANRLINTNALYFEPMEQSDNSKLVFRLKTDTKAYIDFIYALEPESYQLTFQIRLNGMDQVIADNSNFIELEWMQQSPSQEKDIEAQRRTSGVHYMYLDEDVDYLSETSDESEALKTKVKWIAFKQQYFSSALIADDSFLNPTDVAHQSSGLNDSTVKKFSARLSLPFDKSSDEKIDMKFYFGPNHFQTLRKMKLNLEKLVPLGWGIFGWVNRFLVIPVFNFLNTFNLNYGIIILILTIGIKLLLLPLTYKSYMSTAKMKVLRPEVEEIQGKHKDEPMKSQQEMLALYRKAGVNPLGGCLPMLLQFPILLAMFNFFPASIELRQESFLWAKDLSTYDSILDLPFNIPFYGDHVSLFTLLMTISTLLFTMFNSQMTATNPQMKWMMYLMPIIFLGVFNSYSAGLSYYYFLANVISIGQQFMFRRFVDEDEIHRKIQENKKKPSSNKKSKFQQRLEKMAKERGYKLPK
ncbi:MAG TPA: membrane protein insertase YidC [Bacteroidia bacterium]|nr:membrane protein insertase YidC [Bacteroidia bacterium]HNT81159.1 membrane protein insertase YidC [Bacteroidia bacterium]